GVHGLGQQSTDPVGGVKDFDLEPRISRLQLPTRCFSSLDGVELRLEAAVDDRREPFGWRPVGSYCLLRLRLVERDNGLFHRCSSTAVGLKQASETPAAETRARARSDQNLTAF